MGNCAGGELTSEQKRELLRSQDLSSLIAKNNEQYETTVKIILLGTGDSGKSTFLRQIKALHGSKGLSVEEKKFKEIATRNCLENMQNFIEFCREEGIDLPEKVSEDVSTMLTVTSLDKAAISAIGHIVKNEEFLEVFKEHGSEAQIPSTSPYFWENVRRIGKSDYVPTKDDIVRAKIRTTGIIETNFVVGDTAFNLVDVGGQRSERRKWLHCFDNVSSSIFLCAIDEYNDVSLEEDRDSDRFFESVSLFEKLSASTFLAQVPLILFLNKVDLLVEKLQRHPLSEFTEKFPDFPKFASKRQGSEEDIALAYFKNLFKKKYAGESRFFCYFTCALDDKQCENVFNTIRDEAIAEVIANQGQL